MKGVMRMAAAISELILGPVLFHWPVETLRDFYFRIADEAPVDVVYLGEVVCHKRAPFFAPYLDEVAERLTAAGKRVVFSTLAEVMLPAERRLVEAVCAIDDRLVEANDVSALSHLAGRPHHIGTTMNVYNEDTLRFLAGKGAVHVSLPAELPGDALRALGAAAGTLGVSLDVQVFGRVPLALSARCYHARLHGRSKDSCQYACEADGDGLALETLEGAPFLAINGIQTLSHSCLNLAAELADLKNMGITGLRLSPHSCDMVSVAAIFRAVLDGEFGPDEAEARLGVLNPPGPFANGFFHGQPGCALASALA
ncbi:MAG TPA: U32 family peptidase [Afifellaceae bacterium]|nr:U32 family peptidase [Afifellaceae bacterium]